MSGHAVLSPSGAAAWMRCAGKLAMEEGLPDIPSEYADEGTAAHELARHCLVHGTQASAFRGHRIDLGHRTYEVTEEMCEYVQVYIDQILRRVEAFKYAGATSVDMLVEVKVDFSSFVGVPDSFGTADVILLIDWPDERRQIDVSDLKFGRGVEVLAEDNEQLLTYALGAFDQFSTLGHFDIISMAIHQPRRNHYDEWQVTSDELLAFGVRLGEAADEALAMLNADKPTVLTPGDIQCRWCKAKATCPALRDHVMSKITDEFIDFQEPVAPQLEGIAENLFPANTDDELLDNLFPAIDLIEGWTKAVRAEIERRALAGIPFTNCKIVRGKKGNRSWRDPEAAEALLKGMRVREDEMYERKLISPTTAEKLMKESPKRWARVMPLIAQSDGPLSVAPIDDKRPAIEIVPRSEEFLEFTETEQA